VSDIEQEFEDIFNGIKQCTTLSDDQKVEMHSHAEGLKQRADALYNSELVETEQ